MYGKRNQTNCCSSRRYLSGLIHFADDLRKKWGWARKWFVFLVLGKFLLNRIIAFLHILNLPAIIIQIPVSLMAIILQFGFG